jgi:BirA family biotin operon repressor/biotin-[acetyl-CoA-carboxylase] ligase
VSDSTTPGEALTRLAAFGRVHLLDTTPSTNDVALGLAGQGEPAVVIARNQTRGRGRFRRPWFSDTGSLTASLLLFTDAPGFPPAAHVTTLAGLAAARAVEQVTGLKALVRWPNDVVLGDKKLAGILCEGRRNAIAVGIGLNVNQRSFPDDIPEAGSLAQLAGREFEPLDVLHAFATELETALAAAGRGELPALLAAVKERSAVMHRRVEVQTLLRRHVGTVVDLDAEGRIVLRTDAGRLVVIGAGQARRLA